MTPEEPDDFRPKPLIGPIFWVMIAFCLICVAAGLAIARLAPLGERAESR